MAVAFGKNNSFNPSQDEWPLYVERLGHVFVANEITEEEKKRAVFLSVIEASTYKLLSSLLAPVKPGEKSYTFLIDTLFEHFNPAPSEIVGRFKFHTRFCKPGESVTAFVSELRSLAKSCNFGDTLETMLRDRIVCGINDPIIQRRLLSEKALTFKSAMELAQGMESAAKNVRELNVPARDLPSSTATGVTNAGENPVNQVGDQAASRTPPTCYRCGKPGHYASSCKYKETVCNKCGKVGHLQKVCRSKQNKPTKKSQKSVNNVQDDATDEYQLLNITSPGKATPWNVSVDIEGITVSMQLDTGASKSLMSESTFRELWPERHLSPSQVSLCSYSGEPIPVLGSVDVNVTYKTQHHKVPLIVVKGSGLTLMGRNWLQVFNLDWQEIFVLQSTEHSPVQPIVQKYPNVFQEGLGTLTGFKAKIIVDPAAPPKYCKARTVPYFLWDKIETELNRLITEGTLEPVETAEWAALIVAVLKPDKYNVRICGDFKQTINPVSTLDKYPIPKVEDLFSTLAGGKIFCKIDLSQAYQQLPLADESKQYVVINTQKGLFRYTRLPFGVSSAPGIFQRVMENVLQGIPNVIVYLDDILLSSPTESDHLQLLNQVLDRLDKAGLRAWKEKCQFFVPSVSYLGHKIDGEGLHPLPDKVQAIQEAPSPTNVQELKAYLGLLTYYTRFLPNMSTVLSPLYRLLQKDVKWRWTADENQAFSASKDLLTSSSLLVHFDPKLKLILACDASAYGIGAVLAHKYPDGSERPIGYASRSLSKAEKNYSQIEKEGLACVFGVNKFHSYLLGHSFELITDHKPLITLFHQHKPTSCQASACIRRWSLQLAAYEYIITFRGTKLHGNADALSRLPLPNAPAEVPMEPELVLLLQHLDESPVTVNDIRKWTKRDPLLAQVLQFVEQGWPHKFDSSLAPYSSRSTELSVLDGCILWGARVVIPPQGQQAVLQELHTAHPGMTRMKALARMYVWWPGLDTDIEESVRLCDECQLNQSNPPLAPLNPWN